MSTKTVFKSTVRPSLAEYTSEYKEGDFVFREGELGTDMFIINDGRVRITQQVGDEVQELAILEKGDFFGEMSVLEDLPRSATSKALTPLRLLRINSATFSQMLRDNPEIAVRMMRKLSRRLRQTDRMLREALSASGKTPPVARDLIGKSEPPSPDDQAAEKLIDKKSGMEFPLSTGVESTLGRKDPVTGIYPEVDLTPVDTQRSTSRRHAKIYRRSGKFYLAEEIGTMNGTFINGSRLETGVPAEVKSGDEVRVGMVVMTFKV